MPKALSACYSRKFVQAYMLVGMYQKKSQMLQTAPARMRTSHPPQTTSYIHGRHIQSVWVIGMLSQGHMGAPLYRYIGQVGPRFGNSGPLEKWKWCHNIMVEANIHLRPLHTSILDMYKEIKPLVCCLKGIWLHPYTVIPVKLAPDFGIQVHLRRGHDATTSCLKLMSTSDRFIHPY